MAARPARSPGCRRARAARRSRAASRPRLSPAIRGARKADRVATPTTGTPAARPIAAGGRNPDPQARIAAGTDRHGNPVEAREPALDAARRPGRSAAAAPRRGRAPSGSSRGRAARPCPGIEDAGRAGAERGIDGEDAHGLSDDAPHAARRRPEKPPARGRARAPRRVDYSQVIG